LKITFIGGGNMAQAIAGGLIKKGFDPAAICAVEPMAETRHRLAGEFKVRAVESATEAAPFGELVVMAVKPQQMREAAAAVRPYIAGSLVLSIAAGTRLTDIQRWLGGHALLARCMPNTPALVREGITGLYCAPGTSAEQRAMAREVLQAVGQVVEVEEEVLLDPVTAVSGSGPAYVFYFIEAMQQAAQSLGLSAAQGKALAIQTFVGAARLAAESPDEPSVLRQRVTSKGGTTERALASMNEDKVGEAIARAIRAANTRAGELGDLLGKD
jgi:pyrroline-5-carboxylate reductase